MVIIVLKLYKREKTKKKRKAYEKKRAEIINNCEKKQEKAENEKAGYVGRS